MKQDFNDNDKTQGYVNREKEAHLKLQQAEKECNNTKQLLEDTLRKKDGLAKENRELQTLCEELMGIVEGNANNST